MVRIRTAEELANVVGVSTKRVEAGDKAAEYFADGEPDREDDE